MLYLIFVILLCLQTTIILSAPLQFPLLQPLHGTLEQQRLALEEQMFALQQFQSMQHFQSLKLMPAATSLTNPPILLIFPNEDRESKLKDKTLSVYKDDESDHDSIIIDAKNDFQDIQNDSKGVKAVLLVPNGRGIIGDLISGIPFFPIEINVPDSIAFIYKWFSDLIAGWGSQQRSPTQDIRSVMKFLRTKQETPIMMIPLNQPYF